MGQQMTVLSLHLVQNMFERIWQWKRRKVKRSDEVCYPEDVAEPIEKVVMEDHTELEETDAIKQDIPSFEVEANGQMTLFS